MSANGRSWQVRGASCRRQCGTAPRPIRGLCTVNTAFETSNSLHRDNPRFTLSSRSSCVTVGVGIPSNTTVPVPSTDQHCCALTVAASPYIIWSRLDTATSLAISASNHGLRENRVAVRLLRLILLPSNSSS